MILRSLVVTILLGAPAIAQETDCTTAEVQMDLTRCAEQDWVEADTDLNAAYTDAMAVMVDADAALAPDLAGAADQLRSAQRAWIAFRDAACAAEGYLVRGGSMEPMVVYDCRARLTIARTQDLRLLARPD